MYINFSNGKKTDSGKILDLLNNLPHGSGINGDWFADVTSRRVYVYNTYSAMNGFGSYCHDYEFRLTFNRKDLDLLDLKVLGRKLKCCGYGLTDYLDSLFFQS